MQKSTIVFPECFTRDTKAAMIGTAASTSRGRSRAGRGGNRIVPAMAAEYAADEFGYARPFSFWPACSDQARLI
jgi:hypothetical protein